MVSLRALALPALVATAACGFSDETPSLDEGTTLPPTTSGVTSMETGDGTGATGDGTGSTTTQGDGDGGDGDGTSVGDGDGTSAGDGDGTSVGDGDGTSAGDGDGTSVGDGDGTSVGDGDGTSGDGDGTSGDGDGTSGDGDGTSGDGDGTSGDGDGTWGDGDGDGASALCQIAQMQPSSVGCVFHGNKMQNFEEEPSSLVVGNVSQTATATVQLYYGDAGVETPVGGPVSVPPGQSQEFVMSSPTQPGDVSVLRIGGAYKVVSDVPLVAYQHSPISAEAHNDSSMLLPDHAQGRNFVVAAWPGNVGSDNAYFNVVGIHDATTVTWVPPDGTNAGTGVPAVAAGGSGQVMLNSYDMLQVMSSIDVSGTLITTDRPAWVVGAVPCVNIPAGVTYCDHIEEQMIPLEYWGQQYVGAHAPQRGNESFWWRVYSGQDGTTINTNPPQSGFPITLDRGQYHTFSSQESFMFTGDGPFMPVQYLEGENGGAGTGDPASMQAVPTEQFLNRYVFVTGTGYTEHYAQIIRPTGGSEVMVDGTTVTGYYTVGTFEVADWPISEGAHVAESVAAFGINQVGYTGVTSYAYPGGLRLFVINPQ